MYCILEFLWYFADNIVDSELTRSLPNADVLVVHAAFEVENIALAEAVAFVDVGVVAEIKFVSEVAFVVAFDDSFVVARSSDSIVCIAVVDVAVAAFVELLEETVAESEQSEE